MESLLSILSSPVSSKAVQPFIHHRDAIHQVCECSHVRSSVRGVFTSSTSLLPAASQSGARIRVRGAFYPVLRRSVIPFFPFIHSSSSSSSPIASSPNGAIKGNHCPGNLLCFSWTTSVKDRGFTAGTKMDSLAVETLYTVNHKFPNNLFKNFVTTEELENVQGDYSHAKSLLCCNTSSSSINMNIDASFHLYCNKDCNMIRR